MSEKKKLILFDFDGTMVDTFMLLVEFMNKHAGKYGFQGISTADLDKARDMSANELRKAVGAKLWHILILAPWYKRQLNKQIPHLKVFAGMKELFFQLKDRGHKLGIVTFNSLKNIRYFIEANQLDSLFEIIETPGVMTGKAGTLRKLEARFRRKGYKLIYIGDEVMDVEATTRAGVTMIAVTWGYNSESSLKKASPAYIAQTPDVVRNIIESI